MSSQIGQPSDAAPLQVALDTYVTLELLDGSGSCEAMAVQIVRPEASDMDAGLLGANTPLALAILGKSPGTTVGYSMGDIEAVRIVSVMPAVAPADPDAARRRQTILDEARRKAEQTNAEMFAASYGSKWGGYDVGE
jgi:hypothetical protein